MKTDDRLWRRLRHLVGRAIGLYDLIRQGDRLAVGLSGGKDSILLTAFLLELRGRAPVDFQVGVIHLGPEEAGGRLWNWLTGLAPDFIHLEAAPNVSELAAWRPGRPSPCFACARARRRRLFQICRDYGAGALALGHHLDDAAETLLMNIIYSGRLEGLSARQELFHGRLALIRPLILTPEELVIRLSAEMELPVRPSGCPADGRTRRQDMKEMVAALALVNPKVRGNLAAVVERSASLNNSRILPSSGDF